MPGVLAEKANLRKAWKHERKLCREIKRAHQAGKRKQVEHFTRLYLMSFDTKYVATVMANRALKSHRKVPVGQLSKIAENLDPWRGSAEAVTVHFKPKEGNEYDFRPIMDFDIENRALQYLVRAALKAQASIHPRQFSTRGGPPAAGKAVMDALAAGYDWVAEVDIANCYSSFDGEKVPDLLPVPKEVTRNVVTSRHLNLTPGNFMEWFGPEDASVGPVESYGPIADALSAARRGIPQGSAASPLVTDLLLAPAIPNLSGNGTVVGYADNFLVMARERNDAVSMIEALCDALKAHPAGPLRPKLVPQPTPAGKGFEFLGYVFRRKFGSTSVAPSPKNLGKFEHELSKGLERAKRPETSIEKKQHELSHLRRYVRSWTAAFSLWPDARDFRDEKMALIDAVAGRPYRSRQQISLRVQD